MGTREYTHKHTLSKLLIKVSPHNAGIVYFFLYSVIVFGAVWKYNLWLPTSTHNGILLEPSALVNDLVFQPMLVAYFFWTNYSIPKLTKDIKGVFLSKNHYEMVVGQLNKRLSIKWLPYCFLIISTIFVIFAFMSYTSLISWGFTNAPLPTWWSEHPLIFLIASPLILFSSYALLTIVYRYFVLVRCLNHWFKSGQIVIDPWHKDRAGGLGAIGKFSANLGYFLGVIAAMFSLSILQDPNNFFKDGILMISIGIYFVVAPILFFAPIISAKEAMQNYRDEQMKIPATKLGREFVKT